MCAGNIGPFEGGHVTTLRAGRHDRNMLAIRRRRCAGTDKGLNISNYQRAEMSGKSQ